MILDCGGMLPGCCKYVVELQHVCGSEQVRDQAQKGMWWIALMLKYNVVSPPLDSVHARIV